MPVARLPILAGRLRTVWADQGAEFVLLDQNTIVVATPAAPQDHHVE